MRVILDRHILLAIALKRLDAVSPAIARMTARPEMDLSASVASRWEIAIETRLGKLDPGMPIEALADFFESVGIGILPITARHAVAAVDPTPPTRDPFDRLLLAQCLVESRHLAMLDHALRDHPWPLAWTIRRPLARSRKSRP